jgi:hypothetical protein
MFNIDHPWQCPLSSLSRAGVLKWDSGPKQCVIPEIGVVNIDHFADQEGVS